MPEPAIEPTLLDKLREQRRTEDSSLADIIEARDAVRVAFEAERDAFTARKDVPEPEQTAFREKASGFEQAEEAHDAEVAKRQRSLRNLTRRIDEQKVVERRRATAARAAAGTDITNVREPLTYRKDNTRQTSYFADMAALGVREAMGHMTHYTRESALDRLDRHAKEMSIEIPKIEQERERRARKQIDAELERRDGRGLTYDPFHRGEVPSPFAVEQRVNPNRTDGAGGYFVPPLWMDEWIAGLRPGRVTASLCRNMDLPAGTDSINVPKLSTLTTVGIQGADNAPVASTDFTDTAVTANIKTLAGQSDVAIQLLDQSPYPMDQVILTDLLADYDKQYDLQILAGSGANASALNGGQVQGLYSSAGASGWGSYNSVSYTDASPSAWKFLSVAGAMASKIATNRFMFDSSLAYVVHPRRAWWFVSGTDSQNRPLVESTNFGPFNVSAIEPDSVPAQGLVTRLPWGPSVYASANITTADTAGSGTGQDVAVAFLGSDAWAFEGQMHTRVLPELLSGTLQVRFQVYAYIAFLLRYGQSLAIASGTGFAAPTGAVSSVTF